MESEAVYKFDQTVEDQFKEPDFQIEVYKNHITKFGSMVFGTPPNHFYCQNLLLACLLSNSKYKALNIRTNTYETFDNKHIVKAYNQGFQIGRKDFKLNYDFPESMLDRKKAKSLFRRLMLNNSMNDLLVDNKIKRLKPKFLTSSDFLNYGIASGLLFESTLLIEKYKNEYLVFKRSNLVNDKRYDSNFFNIYGFNLFIYLIAKYKKQGNIKFINIWYFLKRDYKLKEPLVVFNFTQDNYKNYIKEHFGITIKKFEKNQFKYEDDELNILMNLSNEFSEID